MASSLISFVLIVAVLTWLVVERFSPDPLLTKLCQLAIFVLAIVLVITKLLPLI